MLFLLSRMKKRGAIPGKNMLFALIIFVFIYGTITPWLGGLSLMDVSSLLGREENLTGRTEVWEQLIPVAMSRPLLGHGFGGFWTTYARVDFKISGSHNGYLDLILEMGFVGFLICAIFLVDNARKVHKAMTHHFDWGVLWLCYLFILLVSNITESSLTSLTSRMLACILFLTASFTPRISNSLDVR